MKKIEVVPYDPNWASIFQDFKAVYEQHLGDSIMAVEHVGSTSVEGLAAKPIIDMDLIVEDDDEQMKRVIELVEALGYTHVGDLGITGREAFRYTDVTIPKDGSGRTWMAHHLYACRSGCASLLNHLYLRDYLRTHPEAVQTYGQLKQRLAQSFPNDINAYIAGKTDFIVNILAKQGLGTSDLDNISKVNKGES